jgi:hypothetical protein
MVKKYRITGWLYGWQWRHDDNGLYNFRFENKYE